MTVALGGPDQPHCLIWSCHAYDYFFLDHLGANRLKRASVGHVVCDGADGIQNPQGAAVGTLVAVWGGPRAPGKMDGHVTVQEIHGLFFRNKQWLAAFTPHTGIVT